MLKRSTIVGLDLEASVVSLRDVDGSLAQVRCDSTAVSRAFAECFPGFVSDHGAAIGQEIFWVYDDLGIMLGGFVPVLEASGEVWEQFAGQHQMI